MKFDKNRYNRLNAIDLYDLGEEWLKNEDEELRFDDHDEDGLSDYTHPYNERLRT